jgi:hypothetical protein
MPASRRPRSQTACGAEAGVGGEPVGEVEEVADMSGAASAEVDRRTRRSHRSGDAARRTDLETRLSPRVSKSDRAHRFSAPNRCGGVGRADSTATRRRAPAIRHVRSILEQTASWSDGCGPAAAARGTAGTARPRARGRSAPACRWLARVAQAQHPLERVVGLAVAPALPEGVGRRDRGVLELSGGALGDRAGPRPREPFERFTTPARRLPAIPSAAARASGPDRGRARPGTVIPTNATVPRSRCAHSDRSTSAGASRGKPPLTWGDVAEGEGFEPSRPLRAYPLSRRAH